MNRPIAHGTVRGYRQHLRHGVELCDLCRHAYAALGAPRLDGDTSRRSQIAAELRSLPRPTRMPGWASQAACGAPGVDLGWFYPEPPTPRAYVAERLAMITCARCPLAVRAECLAEGEREAEWLGEYHGIRGGLTAEERSRYRSLIAQVSAA